MDPSRQDSAVQEAYNVERWQMEMPPLALCAEPQTRRRRHGCGPWAARDNYECNNPRAAVAAFRMPVRVPVLDEGQPRASTHRGSIRFTGFCAFRGTPDTDGSVGFLNPQNHTQHRRAPPFMPEENMRRGSHLYVQIRISLLLPKPKHVPPHMRPRVPLPGISPCIVHSHESLTRRPYGTEGARPSRSAFGCLRPHPASGSRPAG